MSIANQYVIAMYIVHSYYLSTKIESIQRKIQIQILIFHQFKILLILNSYYIINQFR